MQALIGRHQRCRKFGAERVEQLDCLINRVDVNEPEFGRVLPLPFVPEFGTGLINNMDDCGGAPRRRGIVSGRLDNGCIDLRQIVGQAGVVDHTAHVHCVAHFAVQRVANRKEQLIWVGVGRYHQPRSTGAMQADRNAMLGRYSAQLGNCWPRPPGDGQPNPSVGEQRPACCVGGRVDQLDHARRKPGTVQRRTNGCIHDRLRGSQRVAADAHHRCIAGSEHTGCICENVGTPLEDEPNHTQWTGVLGNGPANVVDDPTLHPASRGRFGPSS